ncbi:MAG: glycosyltransferase family 1 protein [Pyrinomonadaceae bacterium MAG19_C2-C3]|nr:glycosyltransferase family 1 protein [Pyrinomonadaceae bacterium MAG19_C2-C3]
MSETEQHKDEDLTAGRHAGGQKFDLVCLSHLRWDFVYQRPQHLLGRAAQAGNRVFFFEEPIFDADEARLNTGARDEGVIVAVPHLPHGMSAEEINRTLARLLDEMLAAHKVDDFALWYYTPMALQFSSHLRPRVTIYDCMDELSMFKGASPELRDYENKLFKRADLVFTGGQSLYEAKREQHPEHGAIHCFPSSVDVAHFAVARGAVEEPADQAGIPRPRFGFFGVVDERFDVELLGGLAKARPDWQFVIIGPVVKIDEASLPREANIHYLGGKTYAELPSYIGGWDVATLLFARNESTRFISPTKTPEYLAAGRNVISTSIRDVVRPYGEQNLVSIADTVDDFTRAADVVLRTDFDRAAWLNRVDNQLKQNSWDRTWQRMNDLIGDRFAAHDESDTSQNRLHR